MTTNNHDWAPALEAYEAARSSIDAANQSVLVCGEKHAALGAALDEIRKEYPRGRDGNKAFGQARDEAFGMVSSGNHKKYFSWCMAWSRIPVAEREQVAGQCDARSVSGLLKAHARMFRKPSPATVGVWSAAANNGAAWGQATMRDNKKRIEHALGRKIPGRVQANDPVIVDIVTVVNEQLASPEQRPASEPEKLSPSAKQKADRYIARELRAATDRLREEIKAELREKFQTAFKAEHERIDRILGAIEKRKADLDKRESALREWQSRLGVKNLSLVAMKADDWKRLMGALHPDRYPDEVQGKVTTALALINSSRLQ